MKQYQIVIVDFPYIDNPTESKKRPCVLLSKPKGKYSIVIVGFITSRENIIKLDKNDVIIQPNTINSLNKVCVAQVYKLTSIMEQDIVGTIGMLNTSESSSIQHNLRKVFELK
jgi:mRNA-degrading endonuclease toxin of MazEF toxin-antitoxin module